MSTPSPAAVWADSMMPSTRRRRQALLVVSSPASGYQIGSTTSGKDSSRHSATSSVITAR
jgi:hypothetical protein